MYIPSHYQETRIEALHALIAEHPLGTLVTQGAGELAADHIPFEIAAPAPRAPFGTLRAHVARANPLWRHGGEPVLAVFQGPSEYVSPSRLREKARGGRVVPTWDYTAVHAHGTLRIIDDAPWLAQLLDRLTTRHEAGQPAPWASGDAPPDDIETLMAAIVGIEIPIGRIEGKWKQKAGKRGATR